ncbi:hypothetical protein [Sphingomonas japonica]|uniref:Uncharacterized protein n=1 Tax=Sphingomonas japonica TaxID=511662 RepID=A0ABX0TWD3_9SPHN|nr:hypothetical protein [Sphingomonas japonica]NIJ22558.1 hypothetical protein [Sphingomonas japonica]
MNMVLSGAALPLALFGASSAMAQDAADLPAAVTMSGAVTGTSDCRFGGASQSDTEIAVQRACRT